jgi:hypothetical protein
MIYPAGTCPPATETNPRFAPSVLFERDHFPNVHTFHIQWAGSLAQNGAGNGLQLPWDPKGYPKMRNFILDIDFSSAGDMVALLQHFNFPNLTTFTQKISLGQQTVRLRKPWEDHADGNADELVFLEDFEARDEHKRRKCSGCLPLRMFPVSRGVLRWKSDALFAVINRWLSKLTPPIS